MVESPAPAAAASLRERAIAAIALLDLTSLNAGDTAEGIAALCRRAANPAPGLPPAAAVCILPRFVAAARKAVAGSAVRVASVAGDFPSGRAPLSARVEEVRRAVGDGADEIDAPGGFSQGDERRAASDIAAIREACGAATLKVILETGALDSPGRIRRAAEIAIASGADFLKTSTGRIAPGATPAAVRILLEEARGAERRTGRIVGVKASGGIRRAEDAFGYLDLARRILGPGALVPARFRIGASALLDDLAAAALDGRR